MAAELFFEVHAAAAREVGCPRDEAQGMAARAQVRDECLERLECQRPGATTLADRRDERVVAAEAGHVS